MMSSPVRSARVDMTITDLVPEMADRGLHHLPVLDQDGRLAGILTQSDLIAALYRSHLEHEARGGPGTDGTALVTTPSSPRQP